MRVKSVSELCGNEILAEPVLTDEKNDINFKRKQAQEGICSFDPFTWD